MGSSVSPGRERKGEEVIFVRRAPAGRKVIQQGDVVFDAQLHHRRFLLAHDGFNAAVKLFGDLGCRNAGEQAQHFALFGDRRLSP